MNEGQAYMWRAWSSIYSILFYISSYFILAREKMNVLFCFAAVLFICSVGVVFLLSRGLGFVLRVLWEGELPFKILGTQRWRIAVNLSFPSSIYFAFEASSLA